MNLSKDEKEYVDKLREGCINPPLILEDVKIINKNMNIIYRDDDINVRTSFTLFKQINEEFKKAGRVHTIAVVMKDFFDNYELAHYCFTEENINIELHGWEHTDFSKMTAFNIKTSIEKSIKYYNENIERRYQVGAGNLEENKILTTLFLPWNRVDKNGLVQSACNDHNLRHCDVRDGEWQGNKIVSFHYWSVGNVNDIFIQDAL